MGAKLLLYALVLAALPAMAIAGQIIVITDPLWDPSVWDESDTIDSLGIPYTATYGEAITTPAGATSIDSFSFYLGVPTGFEFQAFVAPWDNINYKLLSAPTYFSPVTTAADANPHQYIFSGVGVSVTPGTIYEFGVTIDNVYAADSGLQGVMGGNYESNGNSTYYFDWNNDAGLGLSSGPGNGLYADWNKTGCADSSGSCGQAAFVVTFDTSSTPEPGTLTLLGFGSLLLAGMALRNARHRQAFS